MGMTTEMAHFAKFNIVTVVQEDLKKGHTWGQKPPTTCGWQLRTAPTRVRT